MNGDPGTEEVYGQHDCGAVERKEELFKGSRPLEEWSFFFPSLQGRNPNLPTEGMDIKGGHSGKGEGKKGKQREGRRGRVDFSQMKMMTAAVLRFYA